MYRAGARSEGSCLSPDGVWKLTFRGRGPGGSLFLTRHGTGRPVPMYHSSDSCCSFIAWARPHLLLFDDDYRVFTLDPTTRKSTLISGFSNFVVSPDGRWVAGFAVHPPEDAETVGVLSLRSRRCLVVPHTPHQTDEVAGFTRDSKGVIVERSGFIPNDAPTASKHLVQFALASLHTTCPRWMRTP